MKKIMFLIVLITIAGCISGCNKGSQSVNESVYDIDKDSDIDISTKDLDNEKYYKLENEESIWADVYSIALDSFMPIDDGLNSDMEYIAINFNSLSNATDKDITNIMEYFEKYEVDISNDSFETLKEKGMVKEGHFIDGILLEITNVEIVSDDKVIVEGSKFRSGKGAIGVKSTVIKENEEWKLESAEITWIS